MFSLLIMLLCLCPEILAITCFILLVAITGDFIASAITTGVIYLILWFTFKKRLK